MTRSTLKAYYEQVDPVLKRETQNKRIKIADSYLNYDFRDYWKEAELLRGHKRGPTAAVELMATNSLMYFPDIIIR